VIPESRNLNSFRLEEGCSLRIMSSRIGLAVAATVEFHCELTRVTVKIQEVWRYRVLTPEFVLREFSIG
jgi:hypothetical protein